MKKSKEKKRRICAYKIVRNILGFNCFKFADLMGYSYSLIHSVESGRRQPTKEFKEVFSAVTGVSLNSIEDINNTNILDIEGKPYTKDFFIKHRNSKSLPVDEKQIEKYISTLKALLNVSAKNGQLKIVMRMLNMTMKQTMKMFPSIKNNFKTEFKNVRA
jgi:hypothetical protein